MSGKHPRRRKRRKGRKPVTIVSQTITGTTGPVTGTASLSFAQSPPVTVSTIRDRFQLLKQRANG